MCNVASLTCEHTILGEYSIIDAMRTSTYNHYVRMEYPNKCVTEIEHLLTIPIRHLFDDKDLYILCARDKLSKELDGFGIYRVTGQTVTCEQLHGNERAQHAIPRAAQGWLRWQMVRRSA